MQLVPGEPPSVLAPREAAVLWLGRRPLSTQGQPHPQHLLDALLARSAGACAGPRRPGSVLFCFVPAYVKVKAIYC